MCVKNKWVQKEEQPAQLTDEPGNEGISKGKLD